MPEPTLPLLDRTALDKAFTLSPSPQFPGIGNTPFKGLDNFLPQEGGDKFYSAIDELNSQIAAGESMENGKLTGGSVPRSLAEVTSSRYDNFVPGDYNNEDAYGQGQGWGAKMVNGLGKGLVLTGTTFLQSTVGMVNGLGQWVKDGRAASFYDNEMNRSLDEFNKQMEDNLPNYYTNAEKDARWYSPSKLISANFFWDGIIKNMGFAAGAALSGGAYAAGLKALPLTSRLFSVGKAAETLAATEEALVAAGKSAEMYGKVKSLSDKFIGSYNVLNTGGRVVVAGLATTGEAGFEAFHNLNEFRDQKIQEYKDSHFGEDPIGEDLEKINRDSDSVGNSSFLLNTALLSATNYIQFPKILGSSYTAEKGMINGMSKEIADITKDATGKFVKSAPTTRIGKALSGARNVGSYAFSATEGFEEGAQFAISVGTKDYYDKQYKDVGNTLAESITTGISDTLGTDEGMENILIGGLSGALMTGRGRYKQATEKGLNTASAISDFNEWKLSDFTKETLGSVKRGVVLQEEREAALRRGDVLESKDRETDYIINYLTPRIKYGRFDLVLADINEYKQLSSTDEGFAQLQAEGKVIEGDTRAQYLQRLSGLESTAINIKSLYQSLQLRYGNLITPDGTPLYSEEVMNKMIYAATKVADYDSRLSSLSSKLSPKAILISPILDEYVKGNKESFNKAVKDVIESKSVDSDDTLLALNDAAILAERRELFLNEYQDIKNNPLKHKKTEVKSVEKKVDDKGKAVTINVKEGVDLEIGEEYYGGETFNSEEAGEKRRYTKFTVVSEDDKGNVLIQTSDGKRHTITKKGLAKYKLTKTSDVKSKNAIAFIRGAHREFTYNRGKGKHVVGTIAYDHKTDRLSFVSHDGKFKKPITREDLIPQKGFSVAKVYTHETLTPEEVENASQPVSQEEKLAFRNKVIVELYTEAKEELESIDKSIKENQEALEKAKKDIAEVNLTKKGTARTVSSINKVIKKASKIKEDAEAAILVLEARKEELVQILPYLQDLVENSTDLPESGKEMLQEMKDNINNVKELIDSVDREIKLNTSLIESVNYVLKAAFETLQAAVDKFKSANPNVPVDIEGLRDQLERFLGEEGAQQFIDQKLGYTQLVAEFQEALSELEGDLKIPDLNKELSALQDKIGELQSSLKDLQSEQKAKETVLAKFEGIAERNRLKKEEEAKMAQNEHLLEQFLGTHSKEIEVTTKEGGYEPESKKPDNAVVNGTIPIGDGKPHQKRANTFGINLPKLKNRGSLRAIEVTAKTETLAGIPGLMDHLFPNATKEERNNMVAVIFVQDDGDDKFSFVDENGKVINVKTSTNTVDIEKRRAAELANLQKTITQVPGPTTNVGTPKYYFSIPDDSGAFNPKYLRQEGDPESFYALDEYGNVHFVNSTYVAKALDNIDNFLNPVYNFENIEDRKKANGFVVTKLPKTVNNKIVQKGEIRLTDTPGTSYAGETTSAPVTAKATKTVDQINAKYDAELAAIPAIGGNLLNEAIFQVRPTEELKNSKGSLFRESTPDATKKELTSRYKANRDIVLKADNLQPMREFDPSMGILIYEQKVDEKGNLVDDFGAKNTVEEAQLVTKDQMSEHEGLVEVSTLNDPTPENGVSFKNALGRVLLRVPGVGIYKLNTTNIGKRKAESIYSVIYQIAKNIEADPKDGGKNSEHLFSWLKTVIYWGIPKNLQTNERKDATYNNVWFEEVGEENRLFISGKGGSFVFTPSSIEDNKEAITLLLENLYHNVSNGELKKGLKKYREIIGIDKDGTPVYKTWENYQTYLLSKKAGEDAPLVTPVLATKGTQKENRKAIYFVLQDNIDTTVKTPTKTEKVKPVEKEETSSPEGVYTTDEGKTINYSIGEDGDIVVEKGGDVVSIVKKLRDFFLEKNPELSKQEIDEQVMEGIKTRIKNSLPKKAPKKSIFKSKPKETTESPLVKKSIFGNKGKAKPEEETEKNNGLQVYTYPEGLEINYTIDEEGDVVVQPGKDLINVMKRLKPLAVENHPEMTDKEHKETVIDTIKSRIKDSIAKNKPQKPAKVENLTPPKKSIFGAPGKRRITPDEEVYRLQVEEEGKQFEGENWKQVESWLKANFPNLPVYRVKNVIQAVNGAQAWGMLKDGAIYVYENAEVGTIYHEVFEGIWKIFADRTEQESVVNEFKQRQGAFIDRPTGKTIKFSDATDQEIKEQLAEEFRDFVLYKKYPAKPASGKPFVIKLFNDIVDFIKTFFTGEKAQSNTYKLFEKIGSGYYKQYTQFDANLAFANKGIIDIDDAVGDKNAEYRLEVPYVQRHELMQHMTYSILEEIGKNNASLFNVERRSKSDVYSWLKEKILSMDEEKPGILKVKNDMLLWNLEDGKASEEDTYRKIGALEDFYFKVNDNWEAIVDDHIIYLKQYSVEFDENDNILVNDEEKDKGADGHADARKVDYFRKANPAIKLLLSTVPQQYYVKDESGEKFDKKRSSIGGVITLPLDRVFITLKNRLYNSIDVKEMMTSLRDMAKDDINYRSLYTRLTKLSPDSKDEINFIKLEEKHDVELLSAFYKAMKAQNADVKIVYFLPSGDVEIGDAHLADATRQAKQDMFSEIVASLRKNNPYVSFNKERKEYVATKALKDLKLKAGNKEAYIAFLKAIGVTFTKKELDTLTRKNRYAAFEAAVNGVKASLESISKVEEVDGKQITVGVKDLNKYTINLEGRLTGLGAIRATLSNPDFESTYFNINGDKTQTYIGTNVMSDFYDVISKINNIKELQDTTYSYLLTDSFTMKEFDASTGKFESSSVVLNSIFNPATGNKKGGTNEILSTGIVEGIVDQTKGKKKDSSQVTSKDRLIQELNLNHEGWFLNLVPGDASIEWMVRLYNEKSPFVSADDLKLGFNEDTLFGIFRDYFVSELAVSRGDRTIPYVKGREPSDLRFFKSILGEELHDKVTKKDKKKSPLAVYNSNIEAINKAVKNYIQKEAKDTLSHLKEYGVVKYGEEGMEVENLSFAPEGITEDRLILELEASQANFMIANIELHKLVYSDPYFYKDELKRIKNFNSPAQPLMYGKAINDAINRVYNKNFEPNTVGWTNFGTSSLVSATVADVNSFISDLNGYIEGWEETDGGGFITEEAYRNIRIRSTNWNEDEEKQYVHDIGYKKLVNSGARKEQIALYEKKNPGVKSAYTPLKPIVRGSKQDGKSYNDVVLDKFALTPLSFRILHNLNPTSNAIKHYQRMLDSGVDYTVFKSGRKVGGGFENPLYDEKGEYMTAPFLETSEIPFSIISIQTEVPSKDKPEVTQGSQVTKLATMDFMDAGVPLDFETANKSLPDRLSEWEKLSSEEEKEKASPLYKLIKHNETLLNERIQHGYDTLLTKLGIEESTVKGVKTFKIGDITKLVETLTSEVYKREVNENIIDAFRGFKSREVVLEATPAYQQIRNILYSIANKQVTRPTISGGQKVQIPSTLLESTRPIGNKEGMYESDVLKFYSSEKNDNGTIKKVNVVEIMVGRWFKSDLSDEALLRYLNDTPEGQKILSGVGFRIPTQKQNSIDVFKIKQFLPSEFGDSVVIPSALVKKAGSDFDIDKLSLYFKNTYTTVTGKLKIVPFLGYGEKAKAKLAEMYDDGEFLNEKERAIVNKWIKNRSVREERDEASRILFDNMFGKNTFDESYILEAVDDFLESHSTEELKMKVVNEKYKQSLENEYIQSLEDLTSNPYNYEKLILPNSADSLKNLSKKIVKKLGFKEIDYTSVGNMLDRNFMERLRQAFVKGKYAIGIAATAQTNNAQNQRAIITLDYGKLKKQSPDDQKWLGDGIIRFKEFNKVGGKPTLSLARNAQKTKDYPEGQLISDIIGMFIDGYVDISKGPWIMELGATPNTASTWLFLIKLGVPIETVSYFMNQPIIREHLKQTENAGYSWIFIDQIADSVKREYSSNVNVDVELPSKSELEEMIGKKDLSAKEKAQQLVIFNEFFKYSKYAEQLFHVQQGSNFDTANINDPFIVFKKAMQLEKARATMIDGVDKILDNSFVGKLKDVIFDVRDAFSTVLISDKAGSVRNTLQQVLLPYIDMSDRDFVKISQKAVFDLFDWAVQTKEDMNSLIEPILLGDEDRDSAAEQVMDFVNSVKKDENHPLNGNYIIQSLRNSRDSVKEGKPHNLSLVGKNNKTYDQNNVIYGFNELRDYLKAQGKLSLYTKLVNIAVLQSGLSNSPISFTQLIPYQDFKEIYNETLSMLDKMTNLQSFVDLNVFERNNWNNSDIVSAKKSQWLKLKNPYEDYVTGQMKRWVKVPEIEFLPKWVKKAVKNKQIPPMIQIGRYTKEGKEDFLAFTWEKDISKKKKEEMRKKGDYSYINKGLFKKVMKDGKPVSVFYTSKTTGVTYESYLYKAVNAWGDSFRANEFYTNPEQSVIDNGFIKVEEVEDDIITSVKTTEPVKKASVTVVKTTPQTSTKKINIYAGTGENTNLSNFAKRPFKLGDGVTYPTVEHAFQLEKLQYSTAYTDDQIAKIVKEMNTKTPAQLKSFGKTIKGLNVKDWDTYAPSIMKDLIKQSFEQNPKAKKELLDTGNTELTHTQDTTKWGKEFPKLLMEVREELRNSAKGSDKIPDCA